MNDYEAALRRRVPAAPYLTAPTTRELRDEIFLRCTQDGAPVVGDGEPVSEVYRRYALILLCENERLRDGSPGLEMERAQAALAKVTAERDDLRGRLYEIKALAEEQ